MSELFGAVAGYAGHPVVKACGACSLCCKVMAITALEKPAGVWCRHFAKGQGCTIHASLPGECSRFQCYWSISEGLGEEWKPDRSRLVLWSNKEGRVIVEVDPAAPAAWRQQPYYGQLKTWCDRRRPLPLQVLVHTGGRMIVLFPETDIDLGPLVPGAPVEAGYTYQAGREVPFARWGTPA